MRNLNDELTIEHSLRDAEQLCESGVALLDKESEEIILKMSNIRRVIRCYRHKSLGFKVRLYVTNKGVTLRITDNQLETISFVAQDRKAEKLIFALVPLLLITKANDLSNRTPPHVMAELLSDEFDEFAISQIRRGGELSVRMIK